MQINGRSILRYSVLPGIVPRARDLFASGFQYVAYFMALVFASVRLLPYNHPYTQSYNIGKFGLHHVIAQAANQIQFNRKNIDQIIVFAAILFGIVLVALQFFSLLSMLFMKPVLAQIETVPQAFEEFFDPQDRSQDLAGMMMDMTFGVEGIFESCISTSVNCEDIHGDTLMDPSDSDDDNPDGTPILQELGYPYPIHMGMFALFRLYNTALLVVGVLISLYFITAVVMETAQTGTPFGKRYNKVWAPIRFLVAFGLLVPIGPGINASQYIVLYSAKYGSQFASAGWKLFNGVLDRETLLQGQNLISQPGVPEVSDFLQFMFTAKTCDYLEVIEPTNKTNPMGVFMYLVKDPFATPNFLQVQSSTTYEDMLQFVTDNFDKEEHKVIIRFGQRSKEQFPREMGYVYPTCGELTLDIGDPRNPDNPEIEMRPEPGVLVMQRYYWYVIKELWHVVLPGNTDKVGNEIFTGKGNETQTIPYDLDLQNEFFHYANFPYYYALTAGLESDNDLDILEEFIKLEAGGMGDPFLPYELPVKEYAMALQTFYTGDIRSAMIDPKQTLLGPVLGPLGALQAQREASNWEMQDALIAKGWAGGAIWYNKIAEINGIMTEAVQAVPHVSKFPAVMERVAERKGQQDAAGGNADTIFEPKLADGGKIDFNEKKHPDFADAMWKAYSYWDFDGGARGANTTPTGNTFIDTIKAIFGTEGLFNMRENMDVHPLAQLVGVGKSLIEASIRTTLFSGVSTFAGPVGAVAIGFFMSITSVLITAGFVLFYVVPFMPFMYFFFAVGGWIKGIFEAMVGAPLWALAHLRIDGEGLPGQAAASGYFLILEIFLRPILIVFGLLASITIFGALVSMLNEIWDLVTANLTGYDADDAQGTLTNFMRGPVDEFFFTIIYAIVVYLIGMSSFKLIDEIPKNILRWIGSSAQAFNDEAEDAAAGLAGKAGLIGSQVTGQVTQPLQKGLQSASSGLNKPPSAF